MKRVVRGVGAALVLVAGQASAEGLPPTSRIRGPEPVGPSWTGFYIGLGVGAGAVVHDVSLSECSLHSYCGHSWYGAPSQVGSVDGSGEGLFGTVSIGYDRVIRPGWVAGVFADYDFGSTISSDISFGLRGARFEASLDHNASWSLGARLGHLANAGTLLYGTAGYTRAEFDLTGFSSETFDGFFVGAGVETFMSGNWTLKFEYRYSRFNEQNIVDDCPILVDVEPSMHTARVVLSYKLGRSD